jgi:hypothetical protein
MFSDLDVSFFTDPIVAIGALSAVLSVVAYLPYVIDTARGRSRPERATWLIWTLLSAISFASMAAEGAGAAFWFAAVQVIGTSVIFVQSISKGAGRYFCRYNSVILLLAAFGLIAWYFTSDAVYALTISIGVSMLGGFGTVRKAYRQPETETLVTWVISFVAAGLAAASVWASSPVTLAYPVYLFLLYGGLVAAVLAGRTRVQRVKVEVWRTDPTSTHVGAAVG